MLNSLGVLAKASQVRMMVISTAAMTARGINSQFGKAKASYWLN